jgi:hypothetical protein
MMKNTEWGAVAYLSLSKFGINKNININNNTSKTGYSAVAGTNDVMPGTSGTQSTITQPYNTETGYLASTTGNISGVYDMSGGVHEFMAAYKDDDLGESNFTSDPKNIYGEKYFDIYPLNSTFTSYNNRILGDATGEVGPFYAYTDNDGISRYHNSWFSNLSHFTCSNTSWVIRGGYYDMGSIAGQLYFGRFEGGPVSYIGYRIVLAN